MPPHHRRQVHSATGLCCMWILSLPNRAPSSPHLTKGCPGRNWEMMKELEGAGAHLAGWSSPTLLSSDSRQRMEFDQWIDQRSEFPRVVAVHLAPPPLHFGGVDQTCAASSPCAAARPKSRSASLVSRGTPSPL